MDPNFFAYSVTRLRALFIDEIGNNKTIQGTGFWINTDEYASKYCFITNRPNVDPALKLNETYILKKLEIELRYFAETDQGSMSSLIGEETAFFEVENLDISLYLSEEADCALLFPLQFKNLSDGFRPISAFRMDDLANDSFFTYKVKMTDYCHFVGFAGNDRGAGWWDHRHNMPIARLASIASSPHIGFVHPEIKTVDIVLVSGLSFAGASGSPVILDQKGLGSDAPGVSSTSKFIKAHPKYSIRNLSKGRQPLPDYEFFFVDKEYVPRKVLGIMTGHCNDGLEHAGLSYFTRTTSLAVLLRRAGFEHNGVRWIKNKSILDKPLLD